jgi:hypothetical protein
MRLPHRSQSARLRSLVVTAGVLPCLLAWPAWSQPAPARQPPTEARIDQPLDLRPSSEQLTEQFAAIEREIARLRQAKQQAGRIRLPGRMSRKSTWSASMRASIRQAYNTLGIFIPRGPRG